MTRRSHPSSPHHRGGAVGFRRHRPGEESPGVQQNRSRGERGTGTIGTAAGVTVFLVFLLFAVQLLVNLYTSTTVTAAGYDAARTVASRRVDHTDPGSLRAAQTEAEQRFHQLMGRASEGADLSWTVNDTTVALTVTMDSPSILPAAFGSVAFDRIDRTFVVRTETIR